MRKNIQIAYEELMERISDSAETPGDDLVEFVHTYSNNDELHFSSILLQEQAKAHFANPELKGPIIRQMKELAGKILRPAMPEDYFLPDKYNIQAIQETWSRNRKSRDLVFECEKVSKKYPGSDFKLSRISLSLRAGEITGVVGENGNGKTTLLKIIAGEIYPDKNEGRLSYGVLQSSDASIDWGELKPQIAYLPQELGRRLGSVKKSIQYAAALHGITGKDNDKEVEYIIQRLGLGKYKNAIWQELSGGYKLRCALATILVWKPRLMVLDEPLANLDINTQIKVLNDLRDLCKSIKYPIAIILSSQNIEEVQAVSDNMIVLKNGEMLFNNETDRIGEGRAENMFEFKCHYTGEALKDSLRDLEYTGLDNNGFTFFITTPLQVSELHFLKYCAERNIVLTYFQDISISAKRLIVKTTLTEIAYDKSF